jgi:glycosyltransferase involved in cell wall biosynthesis
MSAERKFSVTILTKNSGTKIRQCLNALARFDEVIVLDNGSTDDTLSVAREFPNVKIYESDFIGFGPLKNLAASDAKNDWIVSVDSDEIVTPELAESILSSGLRPEQIGEVRRINHYAGKIVNACGWQNDLSRRVYNRKHTRFGDELVHESLGGEEAHVVRLKGELLHFPFDGAADLISKMQLYSTLFAEANRHRRRSSPAKAVVKSCTTFIRDHFLKRGIFYSGAGLAISSSNAAGAFYKYLKLYEANKRLSTSLVITTYNRKDVLSVVLSSVLLQSELPDEVIIADDGSGEDTREMIKAFRQKFPIPLIHCWHDDNGFRGAAIRNKAIAASSGEYTILIDGDMLLHKDFVKGHKLAAVKGWFLQGSRVWLAPKDVDAIVRSADPADLPPIFNLGNPLNSLSSRFLSRWFSRPADHLTGTKSCNMSFWREDCFRVNGFNEEFTGWGREDSEFAARLMNSGVRRRNLRFGGVAYHLSHPQESRAELSQNENLLQKTIDDRLIYCRNGLVKE